MERSDMACPAARRANAAAFGNLRFLGGSVFRFVRCKPTTEWTASCSTPPQKNALVARKTLGNERV